MVNQLKIEIQNLTAVNEHMCEDIAKMKLKMKAKKEKMKSVVLEKDNLITYLQQRVNVLEQRVKEAEAVAKAFKEIQYSSLQSVKNITYKSK